MHALRLSGVCLVSTTRHIYRDPVLTEPLVANYSRSPLLTDHEHGQRMKGLRRIRQHPPSRNTTMPNSAASSRSPSIAALSRSTSVTGVMVNATSMPHPSGPVSPGLSEDLSRFPSESLHSFSFANQSEDYIHNRQSVLKRSLDFMKDRMGWSVSSTQAALASAQARVSGDVDTQHMLELLAKAQLIGAGNLPNSDQSVAAPLTGPPDLTGENVFDKQFMPEISRTSTATSSSLSPTMVPRSPLTRFPGSDGTALDNLPAVPEIVHDLAGPSLRQEARDEASSEDHQTPGRPTILKRTMTDTLGITLQDRILDTMAQPFIAGQQIYEEPVIVSPTVSHGPPSKSFPSALGPTGPGHTHRWVPAAQAIFTTEAKPPWTIIAANDLACLVFGVTKAEVRKMGILEVVQEERRAWLEKKLLGNDEEPTTRTESVGRHESPAASAVSTLLGARSGGITAQLLSKPSSRSQAGKPSPRRAQTVHSGDPNPPKLSERSRSRGAMPRGVLLCGDVVPIQKRNGAKGSASLWVKEKRVGLIWVLEEIHEDVAYLTIDEEGAVQKVTGASDVIWGAKATESGLDVAKLIPRIPRQGIDPTMGEIDFAQISRRRFFTCPNPHQVSIPCAVEQIPGKLELRVSTFPHMAGIIVVDPLDLKIRSSNSVFCGALFGYEKPDGLPITSLIPDFDKIVEILTREDGLQMLDGMVVPEPRFRRASAFLALKEHRPDAAAMFLQPDGLPANHRDGSVLKIDIQMRVVESEKQTNIPEETVVEGSDEDDAEAISEDGSYAPNKEMVFALWITYSRHVHGHARLHLDSRSSSGTTTPLHQPSPGQTPPVHTPLEIESDDDAEPRSGQDRPSTPTQLQSRGGPADEITMKTTSKDKKPRAAVAEVKAMSPNKSVAGSSHKATIDDYTILEDMGQGAYGQVKLARHKESGKKVVLKYVTKRRILVDTWTRDRKLGTVPLEIHVLDYLRRPQFRHPNIVEMEGFFEDDVNYYIEMAPHGLPGMDLFDYIELRANMEEAECRSIFVQVAQAIHFLHTKALVVHRDIKDENVILDGEGNIKLIDFGSAAYIKSGPFDVFVGTIGKLFFCLAKPAHALTLFKTMQRQKSWPASLMAAKNKTCGPLASCCTPLFTRRIPSTASTRLWTATCASRLP